MRRGRSSTSRSEWCWAGWSRFAGLFAITDVEELCGDVRLGDVVSAFGRLVDHSLVVEHRAGRRSIGSSSRCGPSPANAPIVWRPPSSTLGGVCATWVTSQADTFSTSGWRRGAPSTSTISGSPRSWIVSGFACGREGEIERAGVRRILLTASGGPFRTTPLERLAGVTPRQAVAHPNWVMGPKISVDSATMMNKGLEVIEAHWLFGAALETIQIVVHPQSVIHSMVEYLDGSVVAQLGAPDMRTPIACALGWPERIESGVAPLDFTTLGGLAFERLDALRFPCVALAREAIRQGGTAPAVLNAANEIAVEAFLAGRLPFTGIADVGERRPGGDPPRLGR
jgi:hypothetical protein